MIRLTWRIAEGSAENAGQIFFVREASRIRDLLDRALLLHQQGKRKRQTPFRDIFLGSDPHGLLVFSL